MRRSSIAGRVTAAGVRLIDRLISLDPADPAERVARPAPPAARLWFLNPLAWGALALLEAYRRFVPLDRRPACRFTPSCSTYMALSIRKYGLWNGGRRGLHRLRRCTAFVPGGEDQP